MLAKFSEITQKAAKVIHTGNVNPTIMTEPSDIQANTGPTVFLNHISLIMVYLLQEPMPRSKL